jgi:hypothetical protein
VDRTRIGDLQEPFPLLVRQRTFQHDLAIDSRALVSLFDRQCHPHVGERPALALSVHLQRDRRAGAEARQQERFRSGAAIAAANRCGFVGKPGMGAVVQ